MSYSFGFSDTFSLQTLATKLVLCSELSSGIYCHVKWLSTDVSEVHTASIIRDEWVSQTNRQWLNTASAGDIASNSKTPRSYPPNPDTSRRPLRSSFIWTTWTERMVSFLAGHGNHLSTPLKHIESPLHRSSWYICPSQDNSVLRQTRCHFPTTLIPSRSFKG
jgi:hypothetical protein